MNEGLTWIAGESMGTPLLFCPAELAESWEGTHSPSNGRVIEAEFRWDGPGSVATDYDRACDVANDYYNSIQIGQGTALVLGEENPAATWVSSRSFVGGYVVIWVMLPDEEPDYHALVDKLPPSFFSATTITLECSSRGFLLFPATQSLRDEYVEYIEAICPAGKYDAFFGIYKQGDSFGEPTTEIRILAVRQQS